MKGDAASAASWETARRMQGFAGVSAGPPSVVSSWLQEFRCQGMKCVGFVGFFLTRLGDRACVCARSRVFYCVFFVYRLWFCCFSPVFLKIDFSLVCFLVFSVIIYIFIYFFTDILASRMSDTFFFNYTLFPSTYILPLFFCFFIFFQTILFIFLLEFSFLTLTTFFR